MRAPRTYGTQRTEMRSRLRHDNETDREPISTYARYRRSAKSMPIPNAHRILVIGAGVGGISIARGLLRDGHDVTVFEKRPDMRPGGGAVTIWPNGSTVLDQLGVGMDRAGQLLSTVRIAASTGPPPVHLAVYATLDTSSGPV